MRKKQCVMLRRWAAIVNGHVFGGRMATSRIYDNLKAQWRTLNWKERGRIGRRIRGLMKRDHESLTREEIMTAF